MTATPTRTIHTRFAPLQVADLLQGIFAAELVAPSDCLWLVSPWISDVPVLDNRTNAFTSLVGQWEHSRVRLSQVLASLLSSGATVHVATRPDEHNRGFLTRLEQQAAGNTARLRTHVTDTLHEKGILGQAFYLSGSMNITYNGITINQEALQYQTDPHAVSQNRQLFREWLGGVVA